MSSSTLAGRQLVTELDVPVPMRDGTILRAMVVRPGGGGRTPVLLMRSPYPLEGARFDIDVFALAQRGLALVLQSTRGTGASGGAFEPWVNEASDGADAIAWCAAQPWSNGRVATVGRSYLAHAQLYAAAVRPPELVAMGLSVVPKDPYELTYTGGVLALGSTLNWALGMAGNMINQRAAAGEDMTTDLQEWIAVMTGLPEFYRTTPLADIPVLEKHFPAWRRWLAHPSRDEFWEALEVPGSLGTPAVVVAGWFDIFLRGSLEVFREVEELGSQLIVGPWSHGMPGSALGDVDFGFAASGAAANTDGRLLDFLDSRLRGEEPQGSGRVHLFVMGANEWREEATWPPAGATDTDLFLHPSARLDSERPSPLARPSSFVFDPRDPVPTVGGPNLMPAGDAAGLSGCVDQRVLDGREDILRFSTEPLEADLLVIGSVRLTMYAATSAVDTDWTAKVVDVYPDGTAYNVVDSIVRARFADPDGGGQLLQPGEPHEIVIELGPTAQLFAAGHRLRLDVSSSNFPRFDRNPGTGGTSAELAEASWVTAEQTVFHDALRPSRLTLPVVAS